MERLMSKRKRDLAIAASFRNKPCVVCGESISTVGDHVKTFKSGGVCVEENMWSLCQYHHAEKHSKGLTSFVRDRPVLKQALRDKGWEFEEFMQKWIRLDAKGYVD